MNSMFYKKKLSHIFFVLGIIFCSFFSIKNVQAAGGTFAGGDGSVETPYQIEDCSDLQAINSHLSSYFVLNHDIDCSATTGWNGGSGFNKLGGVVTPFTGSLDGQGYVIQDLYMNRPGELYVGMFSWIGGAGVVKNLGLVDVDINGTTGFIGAIVSYNVGTLTKVYTTGAIHGGNYAAGIVGYEDDGTVTDAYSNVTITSSGSYSGGIVGYFWSGTITRTYAVGHLSGGSVGGAVGLSVFGTASSTFFNTETTGTGSSEGGTGKTTAEMMTQGTFEGWNFDVDGHGTIGSWIMAGYPHLQMEHRTTITSLAELQMMNIDLDADYILSDDIDAASTAIWNSGAGFDPVGDANPDGVQFAGTFDGQGHTIDGLFIHLPETNYVGMFGVAENTTITHVNLTDVDIVGDLDVGAVVGGLFTGTASKLMSSGSVTANGLVGGVIGSIVGGASTLSESYSSATVDASAGDTAGGLVGANQGTISNSYAVGSVSGNSSIGGLVGENFLGTVTKCYAVGQILTEDPTRGGVVGANVNFFLEVEGVVTDSFYDAQADGQNDDGKGTGKTTAQMRNVDTFTDTETVGLTAAWDFVGNPNNDAGNDDYWDEYIGINNGYPFLTFAGLVDETGPSAPTDFVAVASSTDINLSWTNPTDIDFSSITIRRGVTSTPTTVTSGTLVAENVLVSTYANEDLPEGMYYYSIFALDLLGNPSLAATTSARVDITPPSITLRGSSSISLRKDNTYTDEGATASDESDGDITDDIVRTGTVDISTVGTYTLTYTVSDAAGNAAIPVTRTVTVTRRSEDSGGSGGGSRSTSVPQNIVRSNPTQIVPSTTPQVVVPTSTPEIIPEIVPAPAPVSEVVPAPAVCVKFIFTQDLRLGSTGDDVKKLQQYLNDQGFVLAQTGPGSKGNETKYFGSLTQVALINFQKSKNITEELGVLNQKTRELLGCASFESSVESATPLDRGIFKRNLETGMTGEDVRALQVYLNTHGYIITATGVGSPGNETLYFGEKTKNALIRFQKDHGVVPAAGYFGAITRQLFQ